MMIVILIGATVAIAMFLAGIMQHNIKLVTYAGAIAAVINGLCSIA